MSDLLESVHNCILCGVGGQGTVLASRLIAQVAMNRGYFARTAETIGMAQRGGNVISHVRWSPNADDFLSPLIPPGLADVLIAFEPGEAVRCLPYLKQSGAAIVSDMSVPSVLSSLVGEDYRSEPFIEYIKLRIERAIIVDAAAIAKASGSMKSLNIGLIGAACDALAFSGDEVLSALKARMKDKIFEMNARAFEAGRSISYKREAL
ncbi:pyruvate:ferredoxin (flavodoxin) oxidoreductase [Clostridia bacterium]|nr:pyruvate:ferredoxin (flavodoxin) oxidoreductase [Clostridia bacterium]